MLYAIVAFVLIFLIIIIGASFKLVPCNRKYWQLKWLEFKYELIYQLIGFRGVLEDKTTKAKNNNIVLPNASGKIVVITGGTRGIGAEVVKMLVKLDAHVVIGCRNTKAAELLLEKIRNCGITAGKLEAFSLDTSSLDSVRSFAELVKARFNKINVLINNAGIMFGPYKETADGFESQMATNYFGHFLLSHLLLPELRAAGEEKCKARIVNVSSIAHVAANIRFKNLNLRNEYIPSLAYSNSKLAQILFSNHINSLFEQNEVPVSAFSVHPGLVNTDLFHDTPLKKFGAWMIPFLFKTPYEGSKPVLYASLSGDVEKLGGSYISNCEIVPPIPFAFSTDAQQKLFDVTNDLLHIKEFGKRISS